MPLLPIHLLRRGPGCVPRGSSSSEGDSARQQRWCLGLMNTEILCDTGYFMLVGYEGLYLHRRLTLWAKQRVDFKSTLHAGSPVLRWPHLRVWQVIAGDSVI